MDTHEKCLRAPSQRDRGTSEPLALKVTQALGCWHRWQGAGPRAQSLCRKATAASWAQGEA